MTEPEAAAVAFDVPRPRGMSDDDAAELAYLVRCWKAALPRNLVRAARYDGKNAVRDLGIATPPQLRQLAQVLGWPAKAVDMLNARCALDGFSLPGADLGATALPEVWEANRMALGLRQAQASCLTHSPAYVVVTRGDVSAGEPEVLVTMRDALTGFGRWNSRTRALDSFLSISKVEDERPTEMVLYLKDRSIRVWLENGQWKDDETPNDLGVPVEVLTFGSDLRRDFGRSRITRAVMSLHDSALRTMRRGEITAEWYSRPQAVLLGASEKSFGGKNTWQVLLGAIWGIADDEDMENPRPELKQLSAAPQTPHTEQLRMFAQMFAAEASIPVASLGIVSDSNPVSADAYVASREDLIAAAEGATLEWTVPVKRIGQRIIRASGGMRTAADVEAMRHLSPRWRSPIFTSRAQAADAGLKQLQAVPWLGETDIGLELLGLSDDQITRALAERDRATARLTARELARAASRGQQG